MSVKKEIKIDDKKIDFSYKKVRLIKPITFEKVIERYEWNKNTANFELVKKDVQAEIDLYKGQDLKSMIERNILPDVENKGVYIDTTLYNNINIYDLNDALNSELIIESENEKVEKSNIKDNVENESSNSKDSTNNV